MRIGRSTGSTTLAGLALAFLLTSGAPVAADPPPDGGDQATAEQKVIDGYVNKQRNCTPNLPPNPSSVTWDPPGFAPYVGGSGVVHDTNPQLGGVYRADYVNGRWQIEYPYC